MIKTPISLQDLRRRIYVKAKAEPTWRFWGLYVHVCKMETLQEAYQMACGQKTRTTLKWRLKILHRLPLRMDFSDPQAAPTISLSRSYRIQGNLRCFGRACSPMSPEQ